MKNLTISLGLIVLGIVWRLCFHLPNFTPITAIAVVSGMLLAANGAYILNPLAVMLISDMFLPPYEMPLRLSVYACLIIAAYLGRLMKNRKSFLMAQGCGLCGALGFFIITNFSVWLFCPWYSHDLAGLGQAYVLGLPFFRNTLFGDVFWISLLYPAVFYLSERIKTMPAPAAAVAR
jgi:hypothetical protein